MISPDSFGYNVETAESNAFQDAIDLPCTTIRERARREFRDMSRTLRENMIRVIELPSVNGVQTPDAVFPNNWFTTHSDGTLTLYPLLGETRRLERQPDVLRMALADHGFGVSRMNDMTKHERRGQILEGTGSVILSRSKRVAFANASPRTHEGVFKELCDERGYTPYFFRATDEAGKDIYHTNVHMSIGEGVSIFCPEAIECRGERNWVASQLEELGGLVEITRAQVRQMCGNVLNLRSATGDSKLVMSLSAFRGFTDEQKDQLNEHGDLVPVDITTIETIGGGSARCMLAEVFLPRTARID